ncbi:sigma factor [Actinokineospora auranticolor]|uniref:Sigma-70-like protein n=1 Tax=Actinokineospora auranticolor TaxID=155976 RepID=A0A2S6GBE3_9PSEU|nr:sigma factor [Actinokineospora auranticolor]PPK61214.1 sigma-70-like protein [Actinokineospora auranticolor]
MTDEERTKRDPAQARRAFFHEHAGLVKQMIRNRVADSKAAEDIAQEAWAAFFRGYDVHIEARKPPRCWPRS